MNELSVFTGAGGGIYGSKILGWKTLGYVEWEDYPQKVIAQRIKDGIFDEAPIFGDVRAFISEGYARAYRGMVDVVTGGFPCQPFSVAGKRKASADERNMWPATMDVIKAVEPPIVFLENVPGLLSATVDDESGRSIHYFGEILRDLAESGYDVKWCVLGADNVGAIHHRKRLWIFAFKSDRYSNSKQSREKTKTSSLSSQRREARHPRKLTRAADHDELFYTDARSEREQRVQCQAIQRQQALPWRKNIRGFADLRDRPDIPEPLVRRISNGLANGSNQLKAIGNGQFPLTMACAYAVLFSALIEDCG